MGSRHPEEMADWNRSLEVNNEASRPSLVALEGRLDLVPSNTPRPLKGVGFCWACRRRVGCRVFSDELFFPTFSHG